MNGKMRLTYAQRYSSGARVGNVSADARKGSQSHPLPLLDHTTAPTTVTKCNGRKFKSSALIEIYFYWLLVEDRIWICALFH